MIADESVTEKKAMFNRNNKKKLFFFKAVRGIHAHWSWGNDARTKTVAFSDNETLCIDLIWYDA